MSAAAGGEPPLVDGVEVRHAIEYYDERGWTDGLPVVPVTESYLRQFLAVTVRDPSDVVFSMPHLNRHCTVRVAAINAALAGCRPEYFPVVLAAWESLTREGYATKGVWQSTTGSAPLLVVNGPIRDEIGLNCRGGVFGSGFRANATIGRAIRLTAINCFGLHPHQLDQATQATPARYTACIGENEEDSPWPALHADHGFAASDSTVTAMSVRSVIHMEARHTTVPEQLGLDLAGTLSRTGALVHETISGCLVLGPEHAEVFARDGWSKSDLRRFVYEHAGRTREELAAVGKDAISRATRWRLPADHPDAMPDRHSEERRDGLVPVLNSPEALLVVVAGANNAGVSAVVETFGPRGAPPAIALIHNRQQPTSHRGQRQMSTEAVGADGRATIEAALRGLRDTLEADGYLLEWSAEEQNQIGIRVFPGPDACAECLVPPELMRSILSAELGGTPYRVGSITLPAKS